MWGTNEWEMIIRPYYTVHPRDCGVRGKIRESTASSGSEDRFFPGPADISFSLVQPHPGGDGQKTKCSEEQITVHSRRCGTDFGNRRGSRSVQLWSSRFIPETEYAREAPERTALRGYGQQKTGPIPEGVHRQGVLPCADMIRISTVHPHGCGAVIKEG